MTNIFYDTEFIDDGSSIEPISFAMVRDDGAQLYWITTSKTTLARAAGIDWHVQNTLPRLPILVDKLGLAFPAFDYSHPDIKFIGAVEDLAEEVEEFVLSTPEPQLWADYGAYDHVLMSQLWGPMINLPDGIPMYTNDFRTLLLFTGVKVDDIPKFSPGPSIGAPHNALYDALELQYRYEWLLDRILREQA